MADTSPQDDQFQANNPDDTNPMAQLKQDEQLPEDNGTPLASPDGVQDRIGATSPLTDSQSNTDKHEQYDAGREAAAGVDLPDQVTGEGSHAAPPPTSDDAV